MTTADDRETRVRAAQAELDAARDLVARHECPLLDAAKARLAKAQAAYRAAILDYARELAGACADANPTAAAPSVGASPGGTTSAATTAPSPSTTGTEPPEWVALLDRLLYDPATKAAYPKTAAALAPLAGEWPDDPTALGRLIESVDAAAVAVCDETAPDGLDVYDRLRPHLVGLMRGSLLVPLAAELRGFLRGFAACLEQGDDGRKPAAPKPRRARKPKAEVVHVSTAPAVAVRTRDEILAARRTADGCCDRFVAERACDCLALAGDAPTPDGELFPGTSHAPTAHDGGL